MKAEKLENAWSWNENDPVFLEGKYTTQFQYSNQNSFLIGSQSDSLGRTITWEFDTAKRRYTKATFAVDNTTIECTYDANSQLTQSKDRLNRRARFDYDGRGNLIKKTLGYLSANASAWEQQFKVNSQLEWSKDPRGNQTDYEYFPIGAPYLRAIVQPADDPGGNRARTEFTYTAGRVDTITDPVGRKVKYFYDGRNRVTEIYYQDTSTERFAYGTGDDAGLLTHYQDRIGAVSTYSYDLLGRRTKSATPTHKVNSTGNGQSPTDLRTLLPGHEIPASTGLTVEETWTYVSGTDLPKDFVRSGDKVAYSYDPLQRLATTVQHVRVGQQLTERVTYDPAQRLDHEMDPWGRRTFYVYDNNNRVKRVVTELVPNAITLNPSDPLAPGYLSARDTLLNGLSRVASNPPYAIEDSVYDAEGQLIALTDGRGTVTTSHYDEQGRMDEQVEAAGTSVSAKSKWHFDPAGNVIRLDSPRVFDPADPQGAASYTTMTYNNRNGLKSRTEAAGAGAFNPQDPTNPNTIKVTEYFAYYLDGRLKKRIDFREFEWITLWLRCCARVHGGHDPAGHGTVVNRDFAGNATHTARVKNLANLLILDPTGPPGSDLLIFGNNTDRDPPAADTLEETTTRYDARQRPEARSQWLTPLGLVDPNNVPIAEGAALNNGLTTLNLYDDNLADGIGLDSAAGVPVDRNLDQTPDFAVKLGPLLTAINQQLADGSSFFGPGCDGSATVRVSPANVIQAIVYDAIGRTVAVAMIAANTGNILSAEYTRYPVAVDISSGLVVTRTIDAEGHSSQSHADGNESVRKMIDEENNVTTLTVDANGNTAAFRDPNSVGWDAVYDARNRLTSRTDTYDATEKFFYDRNSNLVLFLDAKHSGETITNPFDPPSQQGMEAYLLDARDRRIQCDDRNGGITTWRYDPNSNLLTLTDADNQGTPTKPTEYVYNNRNLQVSEAFPGHNPASNPGDPAGNYDKILFTYDAASRLQVRTDQNGDTMLAVYDLAGRITAHQYRLKNDSTPDPQTGLPSGPVALEETFQYDGDSRVKRGERHRRLPAQDTYANACTRNYDGAGRIQNESVVHRLGGGANERSYTVAYQYDRDNQVIEITYPDGTKVFRDYTPRHRLKTIRYTGGPFTNKELDLRTHDAGARLATSTIGTVTRTFTYRTSGALKDNLVQGITASNLFGLDLAYAYDVNKNKTRETILQGFGPLSGFGFGNATPAAYDHDDRLIGWKRDDGKRDLSWNLTLAGDWNVFAQFDGVNTTTQNRQHTPVHELVRLVTAGPTLGYDLKGNLTSTPNEYTMTWELDNRLRSVTVATSATRGLPGTHRYEYDALGRRLAKSVDSNGTGQNIVTTVFAYARDQIAAEYSAGAQANTPLQKYIYGEYIDEPVALVKKFGPTDQLFYYHRNNLYSVTAITNATGAIEELYAYDAYGNRTLYKGFRADFNGDGVVDGSDYGIWNANEGQAGRNHATGDANGDGVCDGSDFGIWNSERFTNPPTLNDSLLGNRFSFTGREYDPETGIYFYRARYYDSRLGRFISRDPIGFMGSLWNLYEFLNSHPTGAVDPIGLYGSKCTFTERTIVKEALKLLADVNMTFPNGLPLHKDRGWPNSHCRWNCRMVLSHGEGEAVEQSFRKEKLDQDLADLADALSDECFASLGDQWITRRFGRLAKEVLAGSACSFDQDSDWKDNQAGRDCGKDLTTCWKKGDDEDAVCERCCAAKGVGAGTREGPGTSRPYGKRCKPRYENYLGVRPK